MSTDSCMGSRLVRSGPTTRYMEDDGGGGITVLLELETQTDRQTDREWKLTSGFYLLPNLLH